MPIKEEDRGDIYEQLRKIENWSAWKDEKNENKKTKEEVVGVGAGKSREGSEVVEAAVLEDDLRQLTDLRRWSTSVY